jgi:hypothetical protein
VEVFSMVAQHSVTTTRSTTGLAARVVLTLLGAAGLVVGAFLDWWRDTVGTDLSYKAFYQTTFTTTDNFVQTAGFVSIVLGLAALVGLAMASGWLTRLAGVLGVVAVVLFGIQIYRVSSNLDGIDVGAWLALAGAVVALFGGFLGRPTAAVVRTGDLTDDGY